MFILFYLFILFRQILDAIADEETRHVSTTRSFHQTKTTQLDGMQSNNVASFLHNSPSSRVSFLPSPTTNFNISFPFIRVTNSPVPMSSRTFAPYV